MRIDAAAQNAATPLQVEAAALAAEADGYDSFSAPETKHDVFTGLALAARATERIGLQSGIAVAFSRTPMTVAVLGNDLQLVSGGRFRLGLGSQVQAHIERRFAMPWTRPAARMEEFITAIRAIWGSWAAGERLHFKGEFYQHTLMTEFFDPGPNPHGNPPILLAAVGELMTKVAGRVADGMLCHPLTTPSYLREVTFPSLAAARGSLDGFDLSLPVFAAVGEDEAERGSAEIAVRRQIAFYASTPAYQSVLDHHGWRELGVELNLLSRRKAWAEMGEAIPDEVLDAFAVTGTAREVAVGIRERFGDLVARVSLYTPYDLDPALAAAVVRDLRETPVA